MKKRLYFIISKSASDLERQKMLVDKVRKILSIFCIFAVFLLSFNLVLASLDIQKEPVNDVLVPEFKNPAVFKFTFKNLGVQDNFTVYNLIGLDIKPASSFVLSSGEESTLTLSFYPTQELLRKFGRISFGYKIKGEQSGVQDDLLPVTIIAFKDMFEVGAYNIALDSESAKVYIKNTQNYEFPEVKARFKSAFFDFEKTFELKPYEKKEFDVPLNKEEIKKMLAGTFIITSEIESQGVKSSLENTFKFVEKAGIVTDEKKSGIIIIKITIVKTNEGNVPAVADVMIKKNALSRLLTTFNIEPAKVERKGFSVYYYFQKELRPSENLTVKSTTNWIFPLILVIAIILSAYLASKYTSSNVIINKKANYVKTAGGEFALKISLNVKAKTFVEKISVIDRIPSMLKIHERFGIRPDKIDEKNRRLEWNIDSLQAGEERVFSYIVYSKVGVFGKYEISPATVVFEKDGKPHETQSNTVFFLSGTSKKEANY
jgi:hypothetical protein